MVKVGKRLLWTHLLLEQLLVSVWVEGWPSPAALCLFLPDSWSRSTSSFLFTNRLVRKSSLSHPSLSELSLPRQSAVSSDWPSSRSLPLQFSRSSCSMGLFSVNRLAAAEKGKCTVYCICIVTETKYFFSRFFQILAPFLPYQMGGTGKNKVKKKRGSQNLLTLFLEVRPPDIQLVISSTVPVSHNMMIIAVLSSKFLGYKYQT